MRFLQALIGLSPLFIATSLAQSDQARDVLHRISAISGTVGKNQNAIDSYNGGLMAALPVAQINYDSWNSLRTAYAHLPDTKFTPEESDEIVQRYTALNEASMGLLDTYRQKAPLLHQAGVAFMVPIMMQALFRQADDYSAGLSKQFPEKYHAPMEKIRTDHAAAWNAAFAVFDPDSNSEPSQNYRRFISAVSPVLGLLV